MAEVCALGSDFPVCVCSKMNTPTAQCVILRYVRLNDGAIRSGTLNKMCLVFRRLTPPRVAQESWAAVSGRVATPFMRRRCESVNSRGCFLYSACVCVFFPNIPKKKVTLQVFSVDLHALVFLYSLRVLRWSHPEITRRRVFDTLASPRKDTQTLCL